MKAVLSVKSGKTIEFSTKRYVSGVGFVEDHFAVGSRKSLVELLAKSAGKDIFFLTNPCNTEGVLVIETEGTDSWYDTTLYALSEGSIGVGDIKGTSKYKVVRRKFITQSPETFADIVLSMLKSGIAHNRIEQAEEGGAVWRKATPEECSDPSIKWETEGSSKYGRRKINRERHIWRDLTMSEFYGGGVVD